MKNPKSLRMSGMLLLLFLISNVNHVRAQTEDGLQVPKMAPAPVNRGYLQYLPPNYSNTTQNYPCIIFLHGKGQRGNGTTQIGLVDDLGVPKFIANGATMCFTVNGVNECFIVLSPQQTSNPDRSGWQGYEVIPFLNYALANYRIDPNRVYMTGLSMGGDGSWDTSYSSENNPNYFAAIAPVSCKGDYNGAKITAARKISVWAFHGDADASVPLSDGKRPINGMNSVNANPAPLWTVIPGGKHDAATWDKVYNPALDNFNSTNIYKWFLTKTRPSTGNQPPTANAGIDKSITLPTNSVVISGTGTDSDGTISTYAWSKISGGAATLTNDATANLTVSGLVVGTYVFKLTVTDNGGATSFDEVTVVVNSAPNVAPTANAGVDKTIALPTNTIVINGSGTDSDGTIAAYSWMKVSGPTHTQSGETTATLTLSGLVEGVYVFQLTVTDNQSAIGTDNVTVTVLSDPIPSAPSNLSATAVSASQINLSWTDGSNNETQFNIERSIDVLNFSTIHSSLANETSYVDTYQLIPATTYYYRISAVNASGSSAYSSVASAITFKLTPTWINKLNVTEDAAGTLTKANSAVLAGASSQEVLAANADGWVETEVDQAAKGRTIGLSDVDVDKTKSTIDYGIELGGNNNVFTWESGVRSNNSVNGVTLNYIIGDVYRIERQNNTILFKRNGVTFRTAAVTSTSILIVDVNMETINGRLYNNKISFGAGSGSPGGRVASSVSTEIAKNISLEKVNSITTYPNPVSTELFISIPEKTEGSLKVRITDSSGRLEWEGTIINPSDIITVDLTSTKIKSGVKIISLMKSNGEVVHKRVQKIE
jgi:predicted esterase